MLMAFFRVASGLLPLIRGRSEQWESQGFFRRCVASLGKGSSALRLILELAVKWPQLDLRPLRSLVFRAWWDGAHVFTKLSAESAAISLACYRLGKIVKMERCLCRIDTHGSMVHLDL